MRTDFEQVARTIHRDSIIVDGHCDTLGRVFEGQRRLGQRSDLGQFDLPRALAGGLTLELMATFVDPARPGTGPRQTLQFIDVFYGELDAYSDLAMPAISVDDVLAAKRDGKVALMLSMEGAEGLEGDLRLLRVFHRLGLRCLGLTWNLRNQVADGMDELGTGGGLTRFGRDVVKECDRLGIVIDLAHLSPVGFEDVLAIADGPLIVSHANCQALCPTPRNMSDAQLEAIADRGGVVGVVPAPPFLGADETHSTLAIMLDHIDHMVGVMGVDGVGLGMDFDGLGDLRVDGIEDVSKLPSLTQSLAERGYDAGAIGKILGGNLLRVFAQVL